MRTRVSVHGADPRTAANLPRPAHPSGLCDHRVQRRGLRHLSDEELLDAYNDMGSSLALEASEVPDGGAGQGGAEQDEEEEEEEGEM